MASNTAAPRIEPGSRGSKRSSACLLLSYRPKPVEALLSPTPPHLKVLYTADPVRLQCRLLQVVTQNIDVYGTI